MRFHLTLLTLFVVIAALTGQIVWGDSIMWGTFGDDHLIWGTLGDGGEYLVWGT